uniref:Cytochrome c oxidase subunit 8, mitochondrial n=1 Tax=Mycena chlorophos TaxID=658473 RepID=A0ABQ0LLP8_MYCCL|nr:predicted protein [Mycena chlorophos]
MASLNLSRTAVATLSRSRVPVQSVRVGRRFAHAPATEYHNIPFDTSNRRALAIKCLSYMGFGFALPFVAVGWQWYKPGGYKNP